MLRSPVIGDINNVTVTSYRWYL